MEPQNDQANEEKLQFININDHCIYKIFEYLPASDLCSTSFTCKRLQTLTQEYFRQKYTKEWVSIEIALNARGNTELEFSKTDNNKVLKYFGKSIQNVRVRSPISNIGKIDLGLLYNFMKNECYGELHSIELNLGSAIKLNSVADDETRQQFRSIESVKIIDVDCVHSTYNGLLQLCANLNSLEIATPADNVYDWLQYIYPNLEKLTLPWVHGQHPESIRNFLQNHHQLRDITCEGIHLRNPRFQNFDNIHRLVFRTTCGDELINIIRQLKCNAHKTIKFLGIELGICFGNIGPMINVINAIQPVNKLEYDATWLKFQTGHLNHLHELNIITTWSYLKIITEHAHAPYLKSLELSFPSAITMKYEDLKKILVPIIKRFSRLSKFSVVFKDITAHPIISQTDLNELEVTRRVRDASNIDFHFYFGRKSNDELPPNLVSSGNTLTVNHHSQHDLYKFDGLSEYSVAEVIFD